MVVSSDVFPKVRPTLTLHPFCTQTSENRL